MNLSLAIVRDNEDPQAIGRVKIALLAPGDGVEMWAAVASPFAGRGHGLFLIPEVGDEVVVGFLNGSAHTPVVLGSLWNGMTPPPSNDPRTRVLQSRDGHRISLIDSADAGQSALVIEDAHGGRVEMRAGGMRIRTAGVLEIEGEEVVVNGQRLSGAAPCP